MAYIVLRVAHGIVAGIGVDTHMHRIFNQLAWVKSSTPEKVPPPPSPFTSAVGRRLRPGSAMGPGRTGGDTPRHSARSPMRF